MRNNFLIPANSKKSMLYFGLFTLFDLILFGTGFFVSLILLITLPMDELPFILTALAPAGVTGFLVMPVPNYHNMRTLLQSIWVFFTTRQKFVWKGWCFSHEEENNQEQVYKR